MKGIKLNKKVLFWAFAIAILAAYVFLLFRAFQISNLIGGVVLAAFPIILLLRIRGEKKKRGKRVPLVNKPDLLPKEEAWLK